MTEQQLNKMLLDMMEKCQTTYEESLRFSDDSVSREVLRDRARTWSAAANLVMEYMENTNNG